MKYTGKQRQEIIDAVKGKVVEELEYDEEDRYWTIIFTDGSEFSFRLMAELV